MHDRREWDKGWFLAAFMALGLLLIAPKVGRVVTVAVLIGMVACLMHPIWGLQFVQASSTSARRWMRFLILMAAGVALVVLFGVYVWPPIKRHSLSAVERAAFEDVLRMERGGDENLEVHIACPINDEKTCVYAGQLVPLFGEAGWQVQPFVDRVPLTNASDGITALRKAGNKEYMMKHWDSGGYVAINEAHLLAVQKAFQTLHIEIESKADPDLAQNVMMLYVGPERENESEPTRLTKSTEWVNGTRTGPFPRSE
jgi:hypothetical protein